MQAWALYVPRRGPCGRGSTRFELPAPAGWKAFEKANALLLRALDEVAASE